MFFQDAMHIQKATVLSDDLISSLGAGESANSRVLQLLPAFASLSDTSDAILKFYKPRTKFACTLSKERYFDPYENNEIVFTDGSVEWKFVERKMPSDPILRVQDTHILCNAQLFLQYTTQSNCLSMLPILKNLQTWTDSTASLDANTDPIARMIVQMIRHNPTCANIVSINMEFRAHCTCVCQSFLMAHADFADLRLMWSTAPKSHGHPASITQSKGNGIPLNVSVFDLLPLLPETDKGTKHAYLYCVAMKKSGNDVRFGLDQEMYTAYIHDMQAWRIPGYTEALVAMPASIPMFPVASVEFLVE